MEHDNGNGWTQYKNLILKELEHNDDNIKKVLEAIQEISNEIASMKTSLTSIKENINNSMKTERYLDDRITELEKDFQVLKTKVLLIGSMIAAVSSIVISILAKYLMK